MNLIDENLIKITVAERMVNKTPDKVSLEPIIYRGKMARRTNMKSNTRNRIRVFFRTLFATKIRDAIRPTIFDVTSSMAYTRYYGTVGAFIRWIQPGLSTGGKVEWDCAQNSPPRLLRGKKRGSSISSPPLSTNFRKPVQPRGKITPSYYLLLFFYFGHSLLTLPCVPRIQFVS